MRAGDTENNYRGIAEGVGDGIPASEGDALRWVSERPKRRDHSACPGVLDLTSSLRISTNPPRNTTTTADDSAIMGVPFEALLPYAIMTGVGGVAPLAAGRVLTGCNSSSHSVPCLSESSGRCRTEASGPDEALTHGIG